MLSKFMILFVDIRVKKCQCQLTNFLATCANFHLDTNSLLATVPEQQLVSALDSGSLKHNELIRSMNAMAPWRSLF